MNINKLFHPIKRNSGRLIVDQYEQIKRGREQQGVCRYCKHQIPLRLMSSHLNVCAFGSAEQTIYHQQYNEFGSPKQMAGSTMTQKKIKINDKNLSAKFDEKRTNEAVRGSFRDKKTSIKKEQTKAQNSSVRNLSRKKDKNSCDRISLEQEGLNKNMLRGSFSKKKLNGTKQKKVESINKSLLQEQYREYFGEKKKKNGISKVKKNFKNMWLELQETKKLKKKEMKEAEVRRQAQLKKREQRIKKIKNEAERLKFRQEKLMKEMEKQRKYKKKDRNLQSKIKEERRESRRKEQKRGKRGASRDNKNEGRNNRNGQSRNRHPTSESYYEQIPMNHPHRTMNFISQTINEQFQMMKEQFQHMNQFFSNFVPFSNNGFVYFERGQESDYSVDSSASSLGHEEENQGVGLFDQQIQLLRRFSYIKKLGRDDQCAICINSIKHQQMVRKLPCQHIFHCQCIDEWLRRRAVCPVCRDQIGQ